MIKFYRGHGVYFRKKLMGIIDHSLMAFYYRDGGTKAQRITVFRDDTKEKFF